MKLKRVKIENIIFISIFILITFGGFIMPFIRNKEINYQENRPAYQIPKFSIKTFLDGTFQSDYENALSDQLPLSGGMKLAQKSLSLVTKLAYSKNSKGLYKNLGGIYMIEDNLIYPQIKLEDIKEHLDNKISNYNKYINMIKDVEWYFYYVEKDTDINFEDNTKSGIYEYFVDNLKANVISQKFKVDNFEEFKKYFYKTDHHWNHIGSYKAYCEIIKMISNDEPIKWKEERKFDISMSGSKSNSIGGKLLIKEPFVVYTFDLPNYDLYINNNKAENYGNKKAYFDGEVETASYGDYYGSDIALIEFDFHNPDKENLLIIGESYDNAINDLLASHFNKTYNIDLRAYETDLNVEFNINKFIKEHDIDKVLLIGNIDYVDSDVFMLKGDN